MLQHLNGLLLPQSGQLHILDFLITAGKKPSSLRELRRRVGLVFQFPEQQLFAHTVEQDVCFGPLNFGMSEQEAKAAARDAVLALGLDEAVLEMNPFQLSSGQLRKVALATILASDPDVFVLDEPTANLDQASRVELLQILHRLCRERGKTIILVTHRLEEVLEFADHYVILENGTVTLTARAEELPDEADKLRNAGIILPLQLAILGTLRERFGFWPAPSGTSGSPYSVEAIADAIAYLMQRSGEARPPEQQERGGSRDE